MFFGGYDFSDLQRLQFATLLVANTQWQSAKKYAEKFSFELVVTTGGVSRSAQNSDPDDHFVGGVGDYEFR